MGKFKLSLLAILLSFVSFKVNSQDSSRFSPKQLQEDFLFLKNSIEKYNPALGVFHPKKEFLTAYDTLRQQLTDSLSIMEFFPYLVQLNASAREGHAYVGESTDTTNLIYHGFFNGAFKFLPISITRIDEKWLVMANFSADSTLKRGDEVLSINGESPATIAKKLKPYMIVDGDIEASKEYKINNGFASSYYWYIDQPESFEILFRSGNANSEGKVKIDAITRPEMVEWRNKRYGKVEKKEESINDVYEVKIDGNMAILTFKTFSKELKDKYKIKPKKLYKQLFRRFSRKGIEHLVIDVRDNLGGRKSYVWEAIPYLAKEAQKGTVYTSTSWSGKVRKYSSVKPHKKFAFTGDIYVLTSSQTFSNGSVMAAYAREFGDAVVIGQETGTRYEGFAAGSRKSLTLPNTKIKVAIPIFLWKFDLPTRKMKLKNRGVIPDYLIKYSYDDLIEKRDLELEKAKELIEQK